MTIRKITTRLMLPAAVFGSLYALAAPAQGHGYVDYPKARQQICREDGGYWSPQDGSGIPNAACRDAFHESGNYIFVQHHEYAANTSDHTSPDAVQASVPDGTLCAGGDSSKAGMNQPSPHWQRTVVNTAETPALPLRFHATTPHNPSYWAFYLSREDYKGATDELAWGDLELIHTAPDALAVDSYYEFDVPLPEGRQGEAILFTRWQRVDPVGEGFYNCSDIVLTSGDEPTEPDDGWYDYGPYVDMDWVVSTGDQARLRVFDGQGQELLDVERPVQSGEAEGHQWALALADEVTGLHGDLVRMGVRTDNGIELDADYMAANRAFLSHPEHHYTLDYAPGPEEPAVCGDLDVSQVPVYPAWPQTDWAGEPSHAIAGDLLRHSSAVWEANWWVDSEPGSAGGWSKVCDLD